MTVGLVSNASSSCSGQVWLIQAEIETGGDCLFLSLTQQLLLMEMLVSNIFSLITDADRKVKSKIIRNETVDYMWFSNHEEFEGWF